MRSESSFHSKCRTLDLRMKAQAEADGDIFLPNPPPSGPVDYVLICMEPSLGRWAKTPEIAKARIESGVRNFVNSLEDFILHYCVSQYLCSAGERYYITDVSKGAMLVEHAGATRVDRYNRWHRLLEDELALVMRPGAGVIVVGNAVADHLRRRQFKRDFTSIMHYSGQAAAARKAGVAGRTQQFEAFRDSVSLRDVLNNAESVMIAAGIPSPIRSGTLSKLSKAQLSESRRQLMFIYKAAFEVVRQDRFAKLF